MNTEHHPPMHPDDESISEWHRDMRTRSASYRVLNSSGWAMRRFAVLVAKTAALALLLALGVWLLIALFV